MKVAVVHDWLTSYGGSEKVLEAILELFPGSPVYTLAYQPENFGDTIIAQREITTSLIEKLPLGRRKYRTYLPLMPFAVEQFDLSGYDVVISSSHAVAKGVLTRADQLHISYVHTPVRYAWDLYFQYLQEAGLERGFKATLARLALHYLRLWDVAAANRVDVFVANSQYVARRIWKAYRRRAEVIYPPVDVDRFEAKPERGEYFLTVSRLVPYKKVDLIVETFTRLQLPLVVIGDGPEKSKIERLAGPTVELMGYQSDEVVKKYLEGAKAFVFAADEDFGIAPVEAQAAGCPVIAYGHGGACETVVAGETGLFFSEQSVDCLAATVQEFQSMVGAFDPQKIRSNAERFSRERFARQFEELVSRAVAEHRSYNTGG